jgi:hypothetical protein
VLEVGANEAPAFVEPTQRVLLERSHAGEKEEFATSNGSAITLNGRVHWRMDKLVK